MQIHNKMLYTLNSDTHYTALLFIASRGQVRSVKIVRRLKSGAVLVLHPLPPIPGLPYYNTCTVPPGWYICGSSKLLNLTERTAMASLEKQTGR